MTTPISNRDAQSAAVQAAAARRAQAAAQAQRAQAQAQAQAETPRGHDARDRFEPPSPTRGANAHLLSAPGSSPGATGGGGASPATGAVSSPGSRVPDIVVDDHGRMRVNNPSPAAWDFVVRRQFGSAPGLTVPPDRRPSKPTTKEGWNELRGVDNETGRDPAVSDQVLRELSGSDPYDLTSLMDPEEPGQPRVDAWDDGARTRYITYVNERGADLGLAPISTETTDPQTIEQHARDVNAERQRQGLTPLRSRTEWRERFTGPGNVAGSNPKREEALKAVNALDNDRAGSARLEIERTDQSKYKKTRPDGTGVAGDPNIYEHKDVNNVDMVFYDDKGQLGPQRAAAAEAGGQHIMLLTSDKGMEGDQPVVRPSYPVGEKSRVFYAEGDRVTHEWVPERSADGQSSRGGSWKLLTSEESDTLRNKGVQAMDAQRASTKGTTEKKSPGDSPGATDTKGPDGGDDGGTSGSCTKPKTDPNPGGSSGAAAEPEGNATKKKATPSSTAKTPNPAASTTGIVKGLSPEVTKALTPAETAKLKTLESKVGAKDLAPTLAKLKDRTSVRGLVGQLDKLDSAAGQRLLTAVGDMPSDSMKKALSAPSTADSLGKMAKNLDAEGAKAARTILKGLDGDTSKTFLKLAGNTPSALLSQGLKTLAPVVDKVGGKAFGSGLKYLDKVLGTMGMSLGTLGAEAIPKVFKTFVKILPAVGAVPGLIDAGRYLNEAASLQGKNKDLAMFATVGAGLNTADVVVGTLLDATGVGAAVDVATGTAFGIAELALDLSFDAEKTKMEANPAGYRAPDWMKAVNLGYGAATGPSGAAALLANYGVDGTVDLLTWGGQKGNQAVGKVISSLKSAGSGGLAILRSLATRGFQSAADALSSMGQSVKNATDGEVKIAGKKVDLNPFW